MDYEATFDEIALDPLVDVIRRIVQSRESDPDSLDSVEIVLELQQEFGIGIVNQAVRILANRPKPNASPPSSGEIHPLWDRDQDG